MKELKPCPFCGGKAVLHEYKTYKDHAMVYQYYVACRDCGTENPALGVNSAEEAERRWNHRV